MCEGHMRTSRPFGVFLVACLLSGPVLGHHAFSRLFDNYRVGTIRGVVTRFTWGMPHPYLYLDVADSRSQIANWMVEGSNIRILESAGWSTIKPGDTISVCGYFGKPNVTLEGLAFPQGVVSEHLVS